MRCYFLFVCSTKRKTNKFEFHLVRFCLGFEKFLFRFHLSSLSLLLLGSFLRIFLQNPKTRETAFSDCLSKFSTKFSKKMLNWINNSSYTEKIFCSHLNNKIDQMITEFKFTFEDIILFETRIWKLFNCIRQAIRECFKKWKISYEINLASLLCFRVKLMNEIHLWD